MSDPRFKLPELPPVEPIRLPWYVPWFWPGGVCGLAVYVLLLGLLALVVHYVLLPWAALWWVGLVLGAGGASAAVACAVFGLRVMKRPRS